MTEEVTNLIAEARTYGSGTEWQTLEQRMIERLVDALERSAAQTREQALNDATEAIINGGGSYHDAMRAEASGDKTTQAYYEGQHDAWAAVNELLWKDNPAPAVAVVPEDPKPDYWPKSLAEAKRILDAIRETSEPANTVFGPGEDNTPTYDWGRGLTISDGAEHREEGNREDLIDELAKAGGPKPLDPTPWFRWCDSEMPGAPAFERYARQSNGTEFKPREGYETDPARYGVTPKAGA